MLSKIDDNPGRNTGYPAPPDRFQRTELLHWAPALGNDAQSLLRIGMSDFRVCKIAFNNAGHPLPIKAKPYKKLKNIKDDELFGVNKPLSSFSAK